MLTTGMPSATTQRRSHAVAALFATAALMNAAMAAASAAATLVAAGVLGPMWGGIPATAGIAGTGIGALALTRVMNRRGPRAGLVPGYAAAAAGGAVAVVSVSLRDVAGLTAGMVLLGIGNAGAQLSRYAAADLYPPSRRGFAIGTVIWAGTVGAVGGPLLLMPSADAAERLNLTGLSGPFLLASLATSAAIVIALARAPVRAAGTMRARVPLRRLVSTPSARSALAVMATGQVVMVAVMTAAPLDMHMHGQGLGSVGAALSAHTLGMFALSPLTGWLIDRAGSRPVMLGGLATLAIAAALAATGSEGDMPHRTAALFLLGYGWNLCFVGGSGRLARGLAPSDRARVEGAVDAAVWGAAATASMGSTVIMSAGSYAVLSVAAGVFVALPAAILLRRSGADLPLTAEAGREDTTGAAEPRDPVKRHERVM